MHIDRNGGPRASSWADRSDQGSPVIEVSNLEATLSSVIEAGAVVTKPIFSFPGGRRFRFLDPSGNELAAMQADAT